MSTFTQLEAGLAILRVAQQFIDLSEVRSNAAWSRVADSDALLALMKEAGWQEGWPYCAAFVEACYGAAARQLNVPRLETLIRSKFNPSVIQTFNNVKRLTHQNAPKPGSVFFMRKGKSALGHAGLVVMAGEKKMCTIEGNTSDMVVDAARDREGDGIYLKIRRISFTPSAGLHLLGFLDPLSSEEASQLVSLSVK